MEKEYKLHFTLRVTMTKTVTAKSRREAEDKLLAKDAEEIISSGYIEESDIDFE